MKMTVAGDVAGSAGACTYCPQGLFHRCQDGGMLPHAEIVVRAPHGDLGADAVIKGAREAAAAPLEIGKDPVAPFGAQRVEALTEEALVIHGGLLPAVTGPAGERWFADPGRLW